MDFFAKPWKKCFPIKGLFHISLLWLVFASLSNAYGTAALIKRCTGNSIQILPHDVKDAEVMDSPCAASNQLPVSQVVDNLLKHKFGIDNRIQIRSANFNTVEQALFDEVKDFFQRSNSSVENVLTDFVTRKNIDPEIIRFMFYLCTKVYVDPLDKVNENLKSPSYENKLIELSQYITINQGALKRITQINEKIKEILEKYALVEEQKTTKKKQERDAQNTEKEKKKESVLRSQTKEALMEIRRHLSEVYNDPNLLALNTLGDVENFLNIKAVTLEKKNTILQARFNILNDPNVRQFAGKLESMLSTIADDFMPVGALYRNTRINEKSEGRPEGHTKELSGILLFRDGVKNKHNRYGALDLGHDEKNIHDRLIIAFSGSNSQDDWKHNFNFKIKEGSANFRIAEGLRAHGGFVKAFEESLQEAGYKLRQWIEWYAETRNNETKNTILHIDVTGHSLGGALALMSGVYIKQHIMPYFEKLKKKNITLNLRLYTFASPPVFENASAKKVDQLIGRSNIIRVWNIGDVVSNVSLLKKSDRFLSKSPLMVLLKYHHNGLSIPLFDHENIGGNFFKRATNIWQPHLADRYMNLIQSNWKKLLDYRADNFLNFLKNQNLLRDLSEQANIDTFLKFLEPASSPKDSPKKALVLNISDTLMAAIKGEEKKKISREEKTLENYEKIKDESHREGKIIEPKLATVSKDTLKYDHVFGNIAIPLTIKRSTTCSIEKIKKNIPNYYLNNLNDKNLNAIACGCCLTKNFFISRDKSLQATLRNVFGKKTNTIERIYEHCQKHCAPVKDDLFPRHQSLYVSMSQFMKDLGFKERWEKLKIK
jgi:hypothetical protein